MPRLFSVSSSMVFFFASLKKQGVAIASVTFATFIDSRRVAGFSAQSSVGHDAFTFSSLSGTLQLVSFCAIGKRRPTLKAFEVTFSPGGACLRLYSLWSTRRVTERTNSIE
jgi:hypothetical protein